MWIAWRKHIHVEEKHSWQKIYISINRRNMKIKYSTYNVTDQDLFPGRGLCVSPIHRREIKRKTWKVSVVGSRLLLLRCNFVRLRYVPEQKVSDVPPLGQCVPWMIRSLDEASFGRRVPWTLRPLDNACLTYVPLKHWDRLSLCLVGYVEP